jgi:hypothetical protein
MGGGREHPDAENTREGEKMRKTADHVGSGRRTTGSSIEIDTIFLYDMSDPAGAEINA